MVNRERYNQELKEAQKLLAELLGQRDKLDREIAQLRQDIGSLAQLAGRSPIRAGLAAQRLEMGLTDSCREVLRAADEALTPAEVRDGLERMGFDTTGYTNILASIQTTLKRMPDVEETEIDGKKAYELKQASLEYYSGLTKRKGFYSNLDSESKRLKEKK